MQLINTHRRTLSRAALLSTLIGCASTGEVARAPSPMEISQLESTLSRDSSNDRTALRLAQAYRASNRQAEARVLLERSMALHPDNPSAMLLLGATDEDLGSFADARRLYRQYLERSPTSKVADEVRQRLPLIQRKELEAAVKASLAREAQLAQTPPTPWTIAVFPFQFVGTDQQFQPLGRALAEMLVTDLSQSSRLRVLERAQVQMLLDEMNLSKSAVVDPATAARAGHLLGAERIIQGSMDGSPEALRLETSIVRVSSSQWPGETPSAAGVGLSERDALTALIDMQKRLALRIYSSLGVQLTEAERARVTRRPTENVNAILAFGRGLQAEDAGNLAAAAQFFQQAASLDASFTAARESAARASDAAAATLVDTKKLTATTATSANASSQFFLPNPLARDAVAEVLGKEGVGSRNPTVDVVIRRP